MMEEIKVTITMTVYNHEKYVEQAIESVLMQKVNFKYELLIGEDCSTDNSLSLVNKYADREEVKIFAREKNMNKMRVRNGLDLRLRSKGKYIITLEGDDYWTDENKLQKQVDFLDNNQDYLACAHKFQVVNESGQVYYDNDFECQFFENNPYTREVFENGYMLSHLNTILYRNFYKECDEDTIRIFKDFTATGGDFLLTAYLIANGKMFCLPEIMSCYRKVTKKTSSSFSARMERNNSRDKQYLSLVNAQKYFYDRYKISFAARLKSAYASAVFKWYREKNKKNFGVVINIIRYSDNKLKYFNWFIYLITVRTVKNLMGKNNERVKF